MKSLPLMTAAAALALSLGACKETKPTVIDTTSPDPMASQLANAAPVTLPPSMTASVTFRCKDNSLAYVDFFKGNTQANVHPTKGATAVVLKADKDVRAKLSDKELEANFDLDHHFKHVDTIFTRVFGVR